MPRVKSDEHGLYIEYVNRRARPTKDGYISPLAPKGTHIREHALVEVKLFSGDSQRLLVTVLTNGKFNEVWYLDGPVKLPTRNQNAKHKAKGSARRRNVGTNNRSRKKVGNKGRNNRRTTHGRVGGSKIRST